MKNVKVNKKAINHGLITLRFFSSNFVPLKNSHRRFDLRYPERGGLEYIIEFGVVTGTTLGVAVHRLSLCLVLLLPEMPFLWLSLLLIHNLS